MEGMEEGKLYLPLWKSVKSQKALLGQSVWSNFVANCTAVHVGLFSIPFVS